MYNIILLLSRLNYLQHDLKNVAVATKYLRVKEMPDSVKCNLKLNTQVFRFLTSVSVFLHSKRKAIFCVFGSKFECIFEINPQQCSVTYVFILHGDFYR